MEDARAAAPVTIESNDLTVTEAAEALSERLQSDIGPVEDNRPPQALEEKKEPDLPVLSDDTKVTLKDGTRVPLRELRRGYTSRQYLTAKTQALAEERARFDGLKASTENHARLVAERHMALDRALDALMPREPDPSLVDSDPQRWKALRADYQEKMGLLGQVQRTAQMEFEAAQAARYAQERDLAHRQWMERQSQLEKIQEAMPQLKQPNASKKFMEDAIDTMAEYGISADELNAMLTDYRLFPAMRDLIRFRTAIKKAPQVKQATLQKPRMLTGGKRMDHSANEARASKAEFEQFKKSGRLDDAAALLARRLRE